LIILQVVVQWRQSARFWLNLVLVVHYQLVRICQTTEYFAHLWQMMILVTPYRLSGPLATLTTIELSE
jgi:hypothetical protein